MTTLESIQEKLVNSYYELVKIETSTVYKVTNAPFRVTDGADNYESIGALLALDSIETNMSFEVPKINISINGLVEMNNDGEYFIETMLGLDYIDKPVTITRMYYEGTTKIGKVEVFKGFIEGATLEYDPSGVCGVSIEIASHWSTFDKFNGRHTNSASQTQYATVDNSFGSDTGLDNCDEVQKEIIWKKP